MNKKGNTLSIIAWMTGTIVIVIFLAGYAYFFNQITATLVAIPSVNALSNISGAAEKVFVPLNGAMDSLTYISFILIVMLGISILIENYYVKRHPIMFAIHLFIVSAATLGAIYIANEYENLLGSSLLGTYMQSHTGATWIILNLPYMTAILGIIGFIVMLVNFNKDPELRSVSI